MAKKHGQNTITPLNAIFNDVVNILNLNLIVFLKLRSIALNGYHEVANNILYILYLLKIDN